MVEGATRFQSKRGKGLKIIATQLNLKTGDLFYIYSILGKLSAPRLNLPKDFSTPTKRDSGVVYSTGDVDTTSLLREIGKLCLVKFSLVYCLAVTNPNCFKIPPKTADLGFDVSSSTVNDRHTHTWS